MPTEKQEKETVSKETTSTKASIHKKLLKIQSELKAPKGQYNSFGKYNYRSCEDVLEAVKPLLAESGLTLTLKDEIEEHDGAYIVDEIDNILEYQKDFMKVCSEIRSKNMMTFPVLTICLLTKDDKFVDEDFARWSCRHNMKWADSNFFVSDDVTSLSNCCRLSSNVKSLGYFNSIGGTALEVGSVKVNTINLARIAYETETKTQYIAKLKKKVILCLQALEVVRGIIIRNIEKGLLPNYRLGLIDIKKQYNTIGIIGIFEALQKFGYVQKDEFGYHYYTNEGIDFATSILDTINQIKESLTFPAAHTIRPL